MNKTNKKILYFLVIVTLTIALYFGSLFILSSIIVFWQDQYSETSDVPMEVVFVTAAKDLDLLHYSVAGVRNNLKHPISKIVLVSPRSAKAIDIAKSLRLDFIDENSLIDLPAFKEWIEYNKLLLKGSTTWYYQQFLKLSYHKIASTKYYFIIDADIVLTKPLVLVSNFGIHTFFVGNNVGHESYKSSVKSLLGINQFVPDFSFVADMMCFDKYKVHSLVNKVANPTKLEFYQAAILAEQGSESRFSEYELYGVYFNFGGNRELTSYLPTSTISKRRKWIRKDLTSIKYKFVPYIAYHLP